MKFSSDVSFPEEELFELVFEFVMSCGFKYSSVDNIGKCLICSKTTGIGTLPCSLQLSV